MTEQPTPTIASARSPRPVRITSQTEQSLRRQAEAYNRTARLAPRATLEMLKVVYARGAACPSPTTSGHSAGLSRVKTFLSSLANNSSFTTLDADLFPQRAPRGPLWDAALAASALGLDEVKSLLTRASLSTYSDPSRAFYLNRALALVAGGNPLTRTRLEDALRSLVADGNSRAARSLRARMQLRDRKGRWIEMGRGVRFKVRKPGTPGGGQWFHGKVEGVDVPNGRVNVRLEDGRLVAVPHDKLEQPKAIIRTQPNKTAPIPDPIAHIGPTNTPEGSSREIEKLRDQRQVAVRARNDREVRRIDSEITKAQDALKDKPKEAPAARIKPGDVQAPVAPTPEPSKKKPADENQAPEGEEPYDEDAPVIARLDEVPDADAGGQVAGPPADSIEMKEALDDAANELRARVSNDSSDASTRDMVLENVERIMDEWQNGDPQTSDGIVESKESAVEQLNNAANFAEEYGSNGDSPEAQAFRAYSEDIQDVMASSVDQGIPIARLPDAAPEPAPDALRERAPEAPNPDPEQAITNVINAARAAGISENDLVWALQHRSAMYRDRVKLMLRDNPEPVDTDANPEDYKVLSARFERAVLRGRNARRGNAASAINDEVKKMLRANPPPPTPEAPQAPEPTPLARLGENLPGGEEFSVLALQSQALAEDLENKPETQDRLKAISNALENMGRKYAAGDLSDEEVGRALQSVEDTISTMFSDTILSSEMDEELEDTLNDFSEDISALRHSINSPDEAPEAEAPEPAAPDEPLDEAAKDPLIDQQEKLNDFIGKIRELEFDGPGPIDEQELIQELVEAGLALANVQGDDPEAKKRIADRITNVAYSLDEQSHDEGPMKALSEEIYDFANQLSPPPNWRRDDADVPDEPAPAVPAAEADTPIPAKQGELDDFVERIRQLDPDDLDEMLSSLGEAAQALASPDASPTEKVAAADKVFEVAYLLDEQSNDEGPMKDLAEEMYAWSTGLQDRVLAPGTEPEAPNTATEPEAMRDRMTQAGATIDSPQENAEYGPPTNPPALTEDQHTLARNRATGRPGAFDRFINGYDGEADLVARELAAKVATQQNGGWAESPEAASARAGVAAWTSYAASVPTDLLEARNIDVSSWGDPLRAPTDDAEDIMALIPRDKRTILSFYEDLDRYLNDPSLVTSPDEVTPAAMFLRMVASSSSDAPVVYRGMNVNSQWNRDHDGKNLADLYVNGEEIVLNPASWSREESSARHFANGDMWGVNNGPANKVVFTMVGPVTGLHIGNMSAAGGGLSEFVPAMGRFTVQDKREGNGVTFVTLRPVRPEGADVPEAAPEVADAPEPELPEDFTPEGASEYIDSALDALGDIGNFLGDGAIDELADRRDEAEQEAEGGYTWANVAEDLRGYALAMHLAAQTEDDEDLVARYAHAEDRLNAAIAYLNQAPEPVVESVAEDKDGQPLAINDSVLIEDGRIGRVLGEGDSDGVEIDIEGNAYWIPADQLHKMTADELDERGMDPGGRDGGQPPPSVPEVAPEPTEPTPVGEIEADLEPAAEAAIQRIRQALIEAGHQDLNRQVHIPLEFFELGRNGNRRDIDRVLGAVPDADGNVEINVRGSQIKVKQADLKAVDDYLQAAAIEWQGIVEGQRPRPMSTLQMEAALKQGRARGISNLGNHLRAVEAPAPEATPEARQVSADLLPAAESAAQRLRQVLVDDGAQDLNRQVGVALDIFTPFGFGDPRRSLDRALAAEPNENGEVKVYNRAREVWMKQADLKAIDDYLVAQAQEYVDMLRGNRPDMSTVAMEEALKRGRSKGISKIEEHLRAVPGPLQPSDPTGLDQPVDIPKDKFGNEIPPGFVWRTERRVRGQMVQVYDFDDDQDGMQGFVVEIGEVNGQPKYVLYPNFGPRRAGAQNFDSWDDIPGAMSEMRGAEVERRGNNQGLRDEQARQQAADDVRERIRIGQAQARNAERAERNVDDADRPLPDGWSRDIMAAGATIYRGQGGYSALVDPNDPEGLILLHRVNGAFAQVGDPLPDWDSLIERMATDRRERASQHRSNLGDWLENHGFALPALDAVAHEPDPAAAQAAVEADPAFAELKRLGERAAGADLRQPGEVADERAWNELRGLLQNIAEIDPAQDIPLANPDVWDVRPNVAMFLGDVLPNDMLNSVDALLNGEPGALDHLTGGQRFRLANDIHLAFNDPPEDLELDERDRAQIMDIAEAIEGDDTISDISPPTTEPTPTEPPELPSQPSDPLDDGEVLANVLSGIEDEELGDIGRAISMTMGRLDNGHITAERAEEEIASARQAYERQVRDNAGNRENEIIRRLEALEDALLNREAEAVANQPMDDGDTQESLATWERELLGMDREGLPQPQAPSPVEPSPTPEPDELPAEETEAIQMIRETASALAPGPGNAVLNVLDDDPSNWVTRLHEIADSEAAAGRRLSATAIRALAEEVNRVRNPGRNAPDGDFGPPAALDAIINRLGLTPEGRQAVVDFANGNDAALDPMPLAVVRLIGDELERLGADPGFVQWVRSRAVEGRPVDNPNDTLDRLLAPVGDDGGIPDAPAGSPDFPDFDDSVRPEGLVPGPAAEADPESTPAPPPAPADPLLRVPRPARPAGRDASPRGYHRDGVILDRNGAEIYAGLRVRAQRDGQIGIVVSVQQEPAYARIEWPDGRRQDRAGRQLVNIDPRVPGAAPAPAAPAAPGRAPAAVQPTLDNSLLAERSDAILDMHVAGAQRGWTQIPGVLAARADMENVSRAARGGNLETARLKLIEAIDHYNVGLADRNISLAGNRDLKADVERRLAAAVQLKSELDAGVIIDPDAPVEAQVDHDLAVANDLRGLIDGFPARQRGARNAGAARNLNWAGMAANDALIALNNHDREEAIRKLYRTARLFRDGQRPEFADQIMPLISKLEGAPEFDPNVPVGADLNNPIMPADFLESRYNAERADRAESVDTPAVQDPRIQGPRPGGVEGTVPGYEPLNQYAQQIDYRAWGPRAGEVAAAAQTRPKVSNWWDLDRHELLAAARSAYGDKSVGVVFGTGEVEEGHDPKEGFFHVEVTSASVVGYDPNSISIGLSIYNLLGDRVGSGSRVLRRDGNGGFSAYNASLSTGVGKGAGFATGFNRYMENWYIANGLGHVSVSAAGGNGYTGGYVWATNGFGWETPNPQGTVRNILDRFRNLNATDKAQVDALRARNAAGDVPTPMEIALVGWRPNMGGKDTWAGKKLMTQQSWQGRKVLTPENVNQQQRQSYDFAKNAKDRIDAGVNVITPMDADLARMLANPAKFKDLKLSKMERKEFAKLVKDNKSVAMLSPAVKRKVTEWAINRLRKNKVSEYQSMRADMEEVRKKMDADLGADYPAADSLGIGEELRDLTIAQFEANDTWGWNFRQLARGEGGQSQTFMVHHLPTGQMFFVKKDKLGDERTGIANVARNMEKDVNTLFRRMGFAGLGLNEVSRSEAPPLRRGEPGEVDDQGNPANRMIILERIGDNLNLVNRPVNSDQLSANEQTEAYKNLANPEDAFKMLIADALGGNVDRHYQNYMMAKDRDSKWWMFPVDHGLFGSGGGWRSNNPAEFITTTIMDDFRSKIYTRGVRKWAKTAGRDQVRNMVTSIAASYRDALALSGFIDPNFERKLGAQLDKLDSQIEDVVTAIIG